MARHRIGKVTPRIISSARLREKPISGVMNLNKPLIAKLNKVVVMLEVAVCLLENSVQMIGRYKGTPVNAAKLITTFTTPPILGISMAINMLNTPKRIVEILATYIRVRSELFGLRFLNISLVMTPEAIFSFEFSALVVAKIMPPIIKPKSPLGSTSLHIIRYAPSASSNESEGAYTL